MNAPIHYLTPYHHPAGLLLVREETSTSSAPSGSAFGGYATTDWKQVHQRIAEIGLERAAHEHELCHRLVAAEGLAVPARLGFASLREYAGRMVGLNGRQTEERVRVGRALASLPVLDAALVEGQLHWSAVRELTRVAKPETDQAWRDWARGRSSRQIEKGVAGRRPGDEPTSRPDPSLIKHVLRWEVGAETAALCRELEAAIRSELGGDGGGEIDDDQILHEILRRATGGVDEPRRAPYQVAVKRCATCKELAIDAGGESHLVDEVVEGMVGCDAQHIGNVDPSIQEGDTPQDWMKWPAPLQRLDAASSAPE